VGTPPAQARDAFDVSQVSQVAPSLVHYSHELVGKLWERPELSPRDRSLVTLAALIARAHTNELPYYVGLALDSGVNPREISEIITHLSFYASRASALSAAVVVRQVFADRKVGVDQLPAPEPKLLVQEIFELAIRLGMISPLKYRENFRGECRKWQTENYARTSCDLDAAHHTSEFSA
jgi:4-carboxymuconolactone decarboxylase